jgi:hypothetical protein
MRHGCYYISCMQKTYVWIYYQYRANRRSR